MDRYAKLEDLSGLMRDSYAFVEDIKSFPEKIPALEVTIRTLLSQTVECTMFLRECSGHGFGGMSLLWLTFSRSQTVLHRKTSVQCMDGSPNQCIHAEFFIAQTIVGDRYFDTSSARLFSLGRECQETALGASNFF